MKKFSILLTVILSAIVAFATVTIVEHTKGDIVSIVHESAFDRVLRTGTLRCGYADWPPYVFTKDATTGKVSGILADVTQAIADKLKLKVEWAENTGWGSMIESLRSHRIDAFCAGLWRNAERGRYLTFGAPIFYDAAYAYVSIDDHRFDKDLSIVNNPDIRISAMDGEMSHVIAKQHFPKATEVSVPQLGEITDVLVNVATHKADIAFNEPSFADDYIKANPGKIRRVNDKPFEYYPTSLAVEIHEAPLRDMLDSALIELQNHGDIDAIISKYNNDPTVFLRLTKPYAVEHTGQ